MENYLRYFSFANKVLKANLNTLKNPYKIFLVVTKSCQSRCLNCHIWREKPSEEMTLLEYEQLSIKLGRTLSWLNISGGEPTDRDDLSEIIKIFIKNCPNLLIVNFTTNGLNQANLIKTAKYLSEAKIPIVGINVSIDGPEEVHIKLRGGNDSYRKAISSLKELRKIKKIKVHASMTLFDKNAHLIEETLAQIQVNIADFKRSQLHLNHAFQSDHYYKNKDTLATNVDLRKINIQNKRISFPFFMETLKSIYLKKLLIYQKTKITPIPCSSMTSNVYISEHGELFTCTVWNKKVGSLRENDYDLKMLINSTESKNLRKQIANKECVNCWSPCEAFPSIIDNIVHLTR